MQRSHLITLVDAYRTRVNRSEATISGWAVGHARLFSRIREGHGFTDTTYNRALQWFSDNWPADLVWPDDIPRPEPSPGSPASKEAA